MAVCPHFNIPAFGSTSQYNIELERNTEKAGKLISRKLIYKMKKLSVDFSTGVNSSKNKTKCHYVASCSVTQLEAVHIGNDAVIALESRGVSKL
jgi:hypothetical protein